MSQGDDGAPERPASPNVPAAAPRPKPPVPTAAKRPPPPAPALEANPFLARESSRDIDVGWLAPEDAAEISLAPAEQDAPPAQAPTAAGDAKPAEPQSVDDSESTPASPPVEKRSRAKVLAFGLLAALLLGGGGFVYRSQVTARSSRVERAAPQPSAEATIEPPAPAIVPPPPPTHTAEPPPSASAEKKKPGASAGASAGAPVSADPASQGILDTTQLPAGRKIVVDGRVLGTSPRKVAVRCGVHRIQIGDLPPESIELPCGGEVNFTE